MNDKYKAITQVSQNNQNCTVISVQLDGDFADLVEQSAQWYTALDRFVDVGYLVWDANQHGILLHIYLNERLDPNGLYFLDDWLLVLMRSWIPLEVAG